MYLLLSDENDYNWIINYLITEYGFKYEVINLYYDYMNLGVISKKSKK